MLYCLGQSSFVGTAGCRVQKLQDGVSKALCSTLSSPARLGNGSSCAKSAPAVAADSLCLSRFIHCSPNTYRGRWYLFPGLFSGKLRHKDGKQLALESRLGGGCCWSWSCRAGLGARFGSGSPKSRGGTPGLTISHLFPWCRRGPCMLHGYHSKCAGRPGARQG